MSRSPREPLRDRDEPRTVSWSRRRVTAAVDSVIVVLGSRGLSSRLSLSSSLSSMSFSFRRAQDSSRIMLWASSLRSLMRCRMPLSSPPSILVLVSFGRIILQSSTYSCRFVRARNWRTASITPKVSLDDSRFALIARTFESLKAFRKSWLLSFSYR